MMAAHSRADGVRSHGGGRSDDSRGPTDSGWAGGGGAWGGDGEPMSQSQGDTEDPEGQGRADAAGYRARGVESRGGGWSTTDQGRAAGMREPCGASGLTGHGGEEGARSHGKAAESKGWGGVQESEAGGGDMGFSSHDVDGDWQTHGKSSTQMMGWGWVEGLAGASGGGTEAAGMAGRGRKGWVSGKGALAPRQSSAPSLLSAMLSSVAVGSGSPSGVRSGLCSLLQGDGGLGSGSGVGLVSSSVMSTVSGELQDTSTHSMKAARLSWGPSLDSCACVAVFSPAW